MVGQELRGLILGRVAERGAEGPRSAFQKCVTCLCWFVGCMLCLLGIRSLLCKRFMLLDVRFLLGMRFLLGWRILLCRRSWLRKWCWLCMRILSCLHYSRLCVSFFLVVRSLMCVFGLMVRRRHLVSTSRGICMLYIMHFDAERSCVEVDQW